MNKRVLLLLIILYSVQSIYAQIKYDGITGKGLQFKSKDNTFFLKYRTRIQPRWDFEYTPDKNLFQNRAFVRRARLKFDGYFITKNLRYKIEYDVVGGYVRDAAIKYQMGRFDIWFGQTKLPGNRERLVSSGDLQLVDRSIYNTYFTLDRDIGMQMHHYFFIGKVLVRDIYAISAGDGILDNHLSEGLSFTGKLEVLPFGKFSQKGDYKFADLFREPKPKLSIVGYIDFNKAAYKERGQLGIDLGSNADLLLLGFDALLKYRGYSALLELGQRRVTDGSPLVYDNSGLLKGSYYTGWGTNFQTSYVLKSNWEFLGRYANTIPDVITPNKKIEDFTFGISKYINGHNFKIQTDFTLRRTPGLADTYIGRFQVEFQF
jgi:hypothetical protein